MPLAWCYPNGHKVLHVSFCFFANTFTFFFFLANPVCQWRHTVDGLGVLVMPDRFILQRQSLKQTV